MRVDTELSSKPRKPEEAFHQWWSQTVQVRQEVGPDEAELFLSHSTVLSCVLDAVRSGSRGVGGAPYVSKHRWRPLSDATWLKRR